MATMGLSAQPVYRSEIQRTPTSEIPKLVDRILDSSTTRQLTMTLEEQEELPKGPIRPSRTLLTVIRRLLERPVGESEHNVLTTSVSKTVTVPDDSDMSVPRNGGSTALLTD